MKLNTKKEEDRNKIDKGKIVIEKLKKIKLEENSRIGNISNSTNYNLKNQDNNKDKKHFYLYDKNYYDKQNKESEKSYSDSFAFGEKTFLNYILNKNGANNSSVNNNDFFQTQLEIKKKVEIANKEKEEEERKIKERREQFKIKKKPYVNLLSDSAILDFKLGLK